MRTISEVLSDLSQILAHRNIDVGQNHYFNEIIEIYYSEKEKENHDPAKITKTIPEVLKEFGQALAQKDIDFGQDYYFQQILNIYYSEKYCEKEKENKDYDSENERL